MSTCAHVTSLRYPLDYNQFINEDPTKDVSIEMWIASARKSDSALRVKGVTGTAVCCFSSHIGDHKKLKHGYPRVKYDGHICSTETWKVYPPS